MFTFVFTQIYSHQLVFFLGLSAIKLLLYHIYIVFYILYMYWYSFILHKNNLYTIYIFVYTIRHILDFAFTKHKSYIPKIIIIIYASEKKTWLRTNLGHIIKTRYRNSWFIDSLFQIMYINIISYI